MPEVVKTQNPGFERVEVFLTNREFERLMFVIERRFRKTSAEDALPLAAAVAEEPKSVKTIIFDSESGERVTMIIYLPEGTDVVQMLAVYYTAYGPETYYYEARLGEGDENAAAIYRELRRFIARQELDELIRRLEEQEDLIKQWA